MESSLHFHIWLDRIYTGFTRNKDRKIIKLYRCRVMIYKRFSALFEIPVLIRGLILYRNSSPRKSSVRWDSDKGRNWKNIPSLQKNFVAILRTYLDSSSQNTQDEIQTTDGTHQIKVEIDRKLWYREKYPYPH